MKGMLLLRRRICEFMNNRKKQARIDFRKGSTIFHKEKRSISPFFLELCDEMGFYVILETDIESHGFNRRYANTDTIYDSESMDWPGTNPTWKKEHLERMERAVKRDQNHVVKGYTTMWMSFRICIIRQCW